MARNWPFFVGVVATGAAVGAVYAARKRRKRRLGEQADMLTNDARDLLESAKSALGTAAEQAPGAADELVSRGSSMMDPMSEGSAMAAQRPQAGQRPQVAGGAEQAAKGKQGPADLLQQSGF